MRGNWLECTSGSGGTGDLVLTASHQFPLLSAPWSGPSQTGQLIRQVRYTILEYNFDPSAVNANLIRAEDGYCPLNFAFTPTLKRSDPTTVVFSSYDQASATYLPQQGTATAPSKQAFGTTAANIRVICSLGAEDNPFLAPIQISSGTIAALNGTTPLAGYNYSTAVFDLRTHQGAIIYLPVVWPNFGLYSTASLVMNAAGSGVTASTLLFGIYEVSSTGVPGKLIANFGNMGALNATATLTSAPLSPPVLLVPGWYYFALLPQWTGTAASAIDITGDQVLFACPGPFGFADSGNFMGVKVGAQTVFSDPAIFTPLTRLNNSILLPRIGLK